MEGARLPGLDCTMPNLEPAEDLSASGEIFKTIQFGEEVAFGDTCFQKSDGKWWKAIDTDDTTLGLVVIALGTVLEDAYGDGLRRGVIRNDAWDWTVPGRVFVPASKGAPSQVEPLSGKTKMIIGYAIHADRLYIDPDNSYVEVP